jgi:hypothetical protein
MDAGGLNGGYPVLAWQGGRYVPPSAPIETPNNVTVAPGVTTVTGGGAVTVVSDPVRLTETGTLVVINVDTGGAAVSAVTAQVTADNVKAIADNGSPMEVRSDLGDIALPNGSVKDLAGQAGERIDIKLTKDSDGAYTLTLTADDKAVQTVAGGARLTLPSEGVTAGTVAVLVNADGSETVIKKSMGLDGQVSVPLGGSATVRIIDNSKDFGDVSGGAWYAGAVQFVSAHELLGGTGGDSFSPGAATTRGMLVTALHRLEDKPAAAPGETFADVAGDAYYAKAVAWASGSGVVNGVGGGNFAPNAEITRQELAGMLYSYYKWVYGVESGTPYVPQAAGASLDVFPDAGEVSGWAEDAVTWAVDVGLLRGRDSGLAPKGAATRAEVATMLRRLLELGQR